jgi:hypothetical protein
MPETAREVYRFYIRQKTLSQANSFQKKREWFHPSLFFETHAHTGKFISKKEQKIANSRRDTHPQELFVSLTNVEAVFGIVFAPFSFPLL